MRQATHAPNKASSGHAAAQRKPGATASQWLWRIGALVVLALLVSSVWMGARTIYSIANTERVQGTVGIGAVDATGMDLAQIVDALSAYYDPIISAKPIYVYASDEAMATQARNTETSSEASVEEENAHTVVWEATPADLGARIDYQSLAETALAEGGGTMVERVGNQFTERTYPVSIEFDNDKVEEFLTNIDTALGSPSRDYDIVVEDGFATVTDGHDGMMVDRDDFMQRVETLLLSSQEGERALVAHVGYSPARIDEESAQRTADAVNKAIGAGANFECSGITWSADAEDLGALIITSTERDGDGYLLSPSIDEGRARHQILQHVGSNFAGNAGSIDINRDEDGSFWVTTSLDATMPDTALAAAKLDEALFSDFRNGNTDAAWGSAPLIEVGTTQVPQRLSFDDALSYGIISRFSSYTTEYTSRAEARNVNIHLAADEASGSIVRPGEEWAFNTVVGDTTEEEGYMSAGIVVGGQIVDDIGGGVCQVATTIFNAVYESGLPVYERHNHSLYIGAYPEGRDAAVSYGILDFRWGNDTSSDVLLLLDYTDTTVTAELYGVDPGYKVATETGDWEPGDEYITVYQTDYDLGEDEIWVEQSGVDGHSIWVVRTVTDRSGEFVREDEFDSYYNPQNRIVVRGSEDLTLPEHHSSYDEDDYEDDWDEWDDYDYDDWEEE